MGFLFIPMPSLDAKFWLAVAALLPLEITALVLYVKAIRVSPLSLSVPFMALSPVFILFFAFIFLGETPSATGLAGIGLIVTGAYLLNASAGKEGALGPIRAAIREKGAVLMAIVSLIYAVTSTLGKVAVEHSSPVFFGFFYPFILTMITTVYLASRGKLALVFSRPRKFVLIGLCTSIMIITHFLDKPRAGGARDLRQADKPYMERTLRRAPVQGNQYQGATLGQRGHGSRRRAHSAV